MKPLAPHTLLLGLGGNLGTDAELVERMRRVAAAVAAWGEVRASSVLRTEAIGPRQPAFLNAALRVTLTEPPWLPQELIAAVLTLEAAAGRARGGEARWGPRAIDVDVLAWGARVERWPGPPALQVPHPRWHQRRFALEPALELLGDEVELPGTGRTIAQWHAEAAAQHAELTPWRLG